MQATPPATVAFVVDTVAPVGRLVGRDGLALPAFTSNTSELLCVSVVDASPIHIQVLVDGVEWAASNTRAVNDSSIRASWLSCGLLPSAAEGNRTLIASVVDAAGNHGEAVLGWIVVDTRAPVVVTRHVGADTCLAVAGTVVCATTTALTFNVTCRPEDGDTVTAPCQAQWAFAVSRVAAVATCGVGSDSEPRGARWNSVMTPGGAVDLGTGVADAMVSVGIADALVVVYTRAVDLAGNAQAATQLRLYVDMTRPGAVAVKSGPEPITLVRTAAFAFEVPDASPGVLRFNYSLVDSNDAEVRTPGIGLI